MKKSMYDDLREAGVRMNSGRIHRDDVELAERILTKYVVVADPQNVMDTQFNLDQVSYNMSFYNKLTKKHNGKIVRDINDFQLIEYPTYIALLDHNSKHVMYVVQFERDTLFGKKSITQVKLWREPEVHKLTVDGFKLTEYVFFKVLFESADCIVTDKQQTTLGRRFWDDRIMDAFSDGFPVYYVNLDKKTKVLMNKGNWKEIIKENEIWSDEKNAQAKKIVICKSNFW